MTSEPTNSDEMRTHRLDDLVAEFLQAQERGENPNREQFVAAHPEHADELKEILRQLDRLQATVVKPDVAAATRIPPQEPQPSTIIAGRYKLIENIGEGGMGSVWVASQTEPVKRKVAIKLIKAGMDSKQVLARFEAERQALAMMDHPNIAKVFDGGMMEHGRPYFVMEYVKGVPFTEYCDSARLSLKQRLELFIPVCQAVQHAHHKGIVHRDLKPSNILICLYDGKPVPKVIDFGLAKALHQQLTDQSLHTAHGMMVGTPVYMSPEQAELNNLDVDTRTDVYSLGVVLYELLTGTTPLERETLRKAAYNEVLRLIKEVEPPKPSLRLSATGLANSAPVSGAASAHRHTAIQDANEDQWVDTHRSPIANVSPPSSNLDLIARNRSTEPRKLSLLVRGDLDWIVMKSLEKERTRRYETATSLARDIERFLNEEPVEACPPSTLYRLKKYVRKHRPQVLAAGVILTALLVSVAALSWGLHRSNEAARTIRKSLAEVTRERDDKNKALTEKSAALEAEAIQREQAERRMIEGILRPIGHGDEPNAAELRAFIDWAALPDNRLKLKVLEVAFEDPETALRVALRAERAMQACVSLSPKRRTAALNRLEAQQRDMNCDIRLRVAGCWLSLELNSPKVPALIQTFEWLPNCSSQFSDTTYFFSDFVSVFETRCELLPQETVNAASDTILKHFQTATITPPNPALSKAFHCLVPRLSNRDLEHTADVIIPLLRDVTDPQAFATLGRTLRAFGDRLPSSRAKEAFDIVIGVVSRDEKSKYFLMQESGILLVSLSEVIDAVHSAEALKSVLGVLQSTDHSDVRQSAGSVIAAIASKLPETVVVGTWSSMFTELLKADHWAHRWGIGTAMQKLAAHLPNDGVKMEVSRLVEMCSPTNDWGDSRAAVLCLGELAPRIGESQIPSVWESLFNVLTQTSAPEPIAGAGVAMSRLAPRLSTEQADQRRSALLDFLRVTQDEDARLAANHVLEALTKNVSVHEHRTVGEILDELDADWNGQSEFRKLTMDRCIFELRPLLPSMMAGDMERIVHFALHHMPMENDENVLRGVGNLLVLTRQRMTVRQRREVIAALLATIDRFESAIASPRQIIELADGLDQREHERIAIETTQEMLKMNSIHEDYYYDGEWRWDSGKRVEHGTSPSLLPVMALADSRTTAKLLSHPGALSEPREWMLQRFEELVLHNGERVFLPLPKEDGDVVEQGTGGVTPTARREAPPARRFHTIHDAAAWIEHNWPDFDLEATMPVTWRE